jgi:hypothetical protein
MASNAFALNASKSDTTLLSQKLIHQCEFTLIKPLSCAAMKEGSVVSRADKNLK